MSRAEDGDDGTQDDLAALAERFAALWREQAARTADDPATAEAMALMARFWRPFQPGGVPGFGAADPPDPTAMMRQMQEQMQAQMETVTAAMTGGAAGAGDTQREQGGADDGTAQGGPTAGTATAGGPSDDRDRRLDEFDRRLRDIEGKLDALLDTLGGGSAPRSDRDRGGAAGVGSKGGGKKAAARKGAAKKSRAKKSAAKRPAGRKPRS